MPLDITWNANIRNRTRLLAGSAPEEIDVPTLDITLNITQALKFDEKRKVDLIEKMVGTGNFNKLSL